jgi:flagellar hook protein FlgE
MSIGNIMRTAVSGMLAQGNKLSAVADNIANADTVGYKRAEAEFSSMIPQHLTGKYVSGGVTTTVRRHVSEQGTLLNTTSITDLAVAGEGFFIVENAAGERFLTRAGNFVPDENGYLVNAAGFYLLGFDISNGQEPAPVANGFTGLERVRHSDEGLRATPSTEGLLRFNLPADAAVVAPADLPSANAATAQYTSKTSLVVHDNLGGERLMDIHFSKTADNTWEVAIFDRANAADPGPFPYAGGPVSTHTLEFDPVSGQLISPSPPVLSLAVPEGQTLNLDISGSSQYAAPFNVLDVNVNGNAATSYRLFKISDDGVMYGTFPNGEKRPTYRIPLANVRSPDNLKLLPGDVFTQTDTSGDVLVGFPREGNFGSVISGAKEQSTVDIASELTAMIEAQRGYTANSKAFMTGAELMDVAVNLKR